MFRHCLLSVSSTYQQCMLISENGSGSCLFYVNADYLIVDANVGSSALADKG